MGYTRWQDLKHKASPEDRAKRKRDVLEEYDRMGYAALRRARCLTQVELAERLDISQGSVASLEARTDLHISTLTRYVRAMGGELEMRAVFPEATFNLEPLPSPEKKRTRSPKAKPVVAAAGVSRTKRTAAVAG